MAAPIVSTDINLKCPGSERLEKFMQVLSFMRQTEHRYDLEPALALCRAVHDTTLPGLVNAPGLVVVGGEVVGGEVVTARRLHDNELISRLRVACMHGRVERAERLLLAGASPSGYVSSVPQAWRARLSRIGAAPGLHKPQSKCGCDAHAVDRHLLMGVMQSIEKKLLPAHIALQSAYMLLNAGSCLGSTNESVVRLLVVAARVSIEAAPFLCAILQPAHPRWGDQIQPAITLPCAAAIPNYLIRQVSSSCYSKVDEASMSLLKQFAAVGGRFIYGPENGADDALLSILQWLAWTSSVRGQYGPKAPSFSEEEWVRIAAHPLYGLSHDLHTTALTAIESSSASDLIASYALNYSPAIMSHISLACAGGLSEIVQAILHKCEADTVNLSLSLGTVYTCNLYAPFGGSSRQGNEEKSVVSENLCSHRQSLKGTLADLAGQSGCTNEVREQLAMIGARVHSSP